jgi:hypothetical protein
MSGVSTSHILDMNEMLEVIQDIVSYMYSLVPYAFSLIAYLRRTGAPIRDKILFVIQTMVWLVCHAEMLILTVRDHLHFERFRSRLSDPVYRTISALSGDRDADSMTGFNRQHLRALMIHLRIPEKMARHGHFFAGEESFIVFLYEIRHGHTYTHMARHVFGGDPRRLSDMIRAMTEHLYTTFYHKITGNSMAMWCTESNITRFRRAIWNRLQRGAVEEEVLVDGRRVWREIHLNIPFETFRAFSHLDCMAHPSGRPGDEPIETTRASERFVNPQRSFYRYVMMFVIHLEMPFTNIYIFLKQIIQPILSWSRIQGITYLPSEWDDWFDIRCVASSQ